MHEDKIEKFRASLEDLSVVAEKLLPVCPATADLLGMVRLAMENDGQLRLLMATVLSAKK